MSVIEKSSSDQIHSLGIKELESLLGSEGIESGPQQADAVGVDTARRTRPVVLLLKDQPFDKADVPTAIGLGPRHHRPTSVVQHPLPLPMAFKALGRVHGGQGFGGKMVGQPSVHLVAEGLLSSREVEVHRAQFSLVVPDTRSSAAVASAIVRSISSAQVGSSAMAPTP